MIVGSLFVFKKTPSVASYSYYESLKISSNSLNGNSIWGGGETFDAVVAAKGLDAWAAFYSASQKSSGGFDPSGALSINGVPYQMSWTGASDYTGNDTIRLYTGHTSTTIGLDTIGAYEKLYVLGTAGGPGEGNYANFAVRVNYTDDTVDETSYKLYDWYDATPVDGVYKWPNLARRLVVKSGGSKYSSGSYDYEGSTSGSPYLQSATIKVDSKKLVKSIDLVLTGKNGSSSIDGIYCGIYAITGMVNISAPNPVEVIYVNNVAETTANIYWESVPRATSYRLDIALDPEFKNILPNYNNRLVNDTTLLAEGLSGDTVYYTRVRAENSEGQSISSNVVDFRTLNETIPPEVSLNGKPNIIQINDQLIITATDISGVKNIEESLDNGETWNIIAESDHAEKTVTENATYCYRATDNYGNTSDKNCITYNNLDTNKPVITINTNGYEEGTWTNQPITLTAESQTINFGETKYYHSVDGANWVEGKEIIFNGETSEDGQEFFFKAVSEAGIESDVASVLVKKDNTLPEGEISSENNSWNSFLNTVTFGLFFNKTTDFSVNPSDSLSGVKNVEYIISEQAFETKEDALSATGWKELSENTVSINPEGDYILYYKITDNAGNTTVINTDGVVLDTTKAIIAGYANSNNIYDLVDGETYYLAHNIIITDNKALEEIKINGNVVPLSSTNVIELSGSENGVYEIEAKDKAGNTSQITINLGNIGNYELDINEENYRTDDKNNLESAKQKLEEILENEGAHATEEESTVIEDIINNYETLIEKINNLEQEVKDEDERGKNVPDIEHVTSSSREEIVDLINTIEDTLEDDSTHLTISEVNQLIAEKEELEEKLARLDNVEEKENTLEIVNHTDTEIIKTSDKEELEELKETAEELLSGNNLTNEERAEVEEEKAKIEELLQRIENAEAAEHTEDINNVDPKLPDNYTVEDKNDLEKAKDDLEEALDNYTSNYTDEEIQDILEKINEINDALDDIARQEEEELRRNTFPTISVTAETTKWVSSDAAGIVATDDFGISDISVSSDGGVNWNSLGGETSAVYEVFENGTYIFRATNEFGNTSEKTIVYHNIDPEKPEVEVDSHGYILGTWTNNAVDLTARNISGNISPVTLFVREQGTEEWQNYREIILTEDTSLTIYEYKAVAATGLESEIVSAEIKKDSIAPTGIISTDDNSWNSFINNITFGIFANKTKDFEIDSSDDRSGVQKIEYVVLEEVVEDEALLDASWNLVHGKVSVEPEKDFLVYYKITDNAGNISIVNTNGIVLDVTAPTIVGLINGQTHALEPEKTYYLTQTILFNDNKGISKISVNGETINVENNILEIAGNNDATLTIVVEDKAGNTESIVLKTGKINIVSDLEHKTVEDKPSLEQEIENLNNLENENPESQEKELIDGLEENYEATIEEINEAEERFRVIEESYATIPDLEHVTSSDEEKIEDLINAIGTIREENYNHLTEQEKNRLNEILDSLNQKLERIEDIKEQIEEIDERVDSYDEETVNKDDLDDLEEIKEEIEDLKPSSNVSDDEREHLEDLEDRIDDLENRIKEAEEALEKAKENDKAGEITPTTVRPEDQTTLEDAAQGYAEALGVFDGNFSLSDLFDINNRISIINSALDILDQVAEFENMVSKLPNPESINFGSRVAVKAAQIAYNELSDYGRSLVGPSLMAKYKAVIEAYRTFLEGSPILYAFETLDVFWWGLTTFFIAGTFILVVRRTHKRYVEDKNDDKF